MIQILIPEIPAAVCLGFGLGTLFWITVAVILYKRTQRQNLDG